MKPRLLAWAMWCGALLWGFAFGMPAQAQVAIWPGTVVAPFVRVQWNGNYVHVCAPFVNLTVDWPRCCGCRPSCEYQPSCHDTAAGYGGAPLHDPAASRFYDHPTRQQLAQAASRLNQALSQFQTADSWQHYLAIDDLASQDSAQNSAIQRHPVDSTLVAVLHHFDAANRDEKNRIITSLPDFQEMHALLANYVAQQPNSLQAETEQIRTVAATSGASTSSTALHMGWAVDTAKMPATDIAQRFMLETIAPPPAAQPTVEELPAPGPKHGT